MLYAAKDHPNRSLDGKSRLELRRRDEVRRLADVLSPISRHSEKIAKMELVLDTAESSWTSIKARVRELKASVKMEVVRFTKLAEIQYNMSAKGTSGKGSSARPRRVGGASLVQASSRIKEDALGA